MSACDGASAPDQLLVVRTSSMGDVIHTLPAVSALRQAFPKISLGWVIEERWIELLCSPGTPRVGPLSPGRPLVERIHLVNTKAWRHRLFSSQTWRQMSQQIRDLRNPHYPIALDFQGAFRSAMLARLSRAPQIYGFAEPRERIAKMFYTRPVPASGRHVVEQDCSLAESLYGCSTQIPEAQLPHDQSAEENCDLHLKTHGFEKFALLNPGAGWGAKQWPPERYGEVAKGLSADGLRCLINYGPGEEAIARKTEYASGGYANAIKLSLTQLIAFTRRASLFIGGDTGPMHLAAALQIPVVAIFGPTDPNRNGPFGTRSAVLRNPASPTTYQHTAQPDEGLLTIGADEVVAAARQLLKDGR